MGSVVTIPNYKLVGALIDNRGPRTRRPFRYTLGVKADVPLERIVSLRDRIRVLAQKLFPYSKDPWHVHVSEIDGAMTRVEVQGYLCLEGTESESSERERLLLELKRLVCELKWSWHDLNHQIHGEVTVVGALEVKKGVRWIVATVFLENMPPLHGPQQIPQAEPRGVPTAR